MKHPLDHRSTRQARKWLDPRVALLLSTQSTAKTKGLENTLKKDDIVIPEYCPVLGIKLKPGGRNDDSMSVDRKDNSVGYVPGNVFVISGKANRLKSNGTIQDLEAILNYMKN